MDSENYSVVTRSIGSYSVKFKDNNNDGYIIIAFDYVFN